MPLFKFTKSSLFRLAGNLSVSAVAIVSTLAFLEFVVFRILLVPDDLLQNTTINEVVRFKPGTRAVFRHPDGRETLVQVNAQGWNSTKADYAVAKRNGVQRIAVVGDSYVHGAFVDVDKGFPHLLEETLRGGGSNVEVYRFGMDGAPLSQYLHMMRREVLDYSPDIVVIPLIHNDFDESYRFLKTRYSSSFMKLARDAEGGIREIAPSPFERGLADELRQWASFRYLYYETGLYLSAKSIVSRLFWGGKEDWSPEFISSAVDIRKIRDHGANRFFAHYVLRELKRLSEERGFRIVFVMDGVREAIYQRSDPDDFEVFKLNRIARGLADEIGVPLLDLQGVFTRHYEAHGRRFEFAYDWHWNEEGNQVVSDALAELLTSRLGWVRAGGPLVLRH